MQSRECRCRCGCLLAKVSVPVTVSFGPSACGIEIRCRRCKSHAVLMTATSAVAGGPAEPAAPDNDPLRAAEERGHPGRIAHGTPAISRRSAATV
jgi:hypothetical protein